MNVLFVCTGNICRSPVAERMLQHRTERAGLDVQVGSAGTRALNGKPMHPDSVRVLRERGIAADGFTSRLLTPALVTQADVIIGLTRDHRAAARQLAPVRWRSMLTLREINCGERGSENINGDVPSSRGFVDPTHAGLDIEDPIGRPAAVFDSVADEIESTMDGLVTWIECQLTERAQAQQVVK